MQMHRDRRATQQWTKIGPPLRGRSERSADLRRLFARSPATRLHCTPRQRFSLNDHDVQIWSNKGLIRIICRAATWADSADLTNIAEQILKEAALAAKCRGFVIFEINLGNFFKASPVN